MARSFFVALMLLLSVSAGAVEVRAPDLRGVNLLRARWRLEHHGLRLRVLASRPDARDPEGAVLGQTPPAGHLVQQGDVVCVVVSRGYHPCAVPMLSMLSVDEARQKLDRLGIGLAVVGAKGDGWVVGQSPPAGRLLESGTVTVRTVPGAAVPSVVGQDLGVAVRMMLDSGLPVRVRRVATDQPAGTVVQQTPMEGMEVPAGHMVQLVVGR